MKYRVMREHLGDRPYRQGDIRDANPASVGHLVKKGILVEAGKADAVPLNKSLATPSNKAAK